MRKSQCGEFGIQAEKISKSILLIPTCLDKGLKGVTQE